MDKARVIEKASQVLLNEFKKDAIAIINNEYKFEYKKTEKRAYKDKEKFNIFMRDGFIDRYTGYKLLNPGILKVFSTYFPDEEDNWITTSMLHNSIKSNWTLEQIGWEIKECGDITEWDGLTKIFINIVDKDTNLLNDNYIKRWYGISKSILKVEDK